MSQRSHKAQGPRFVSCYVLTVSDTRTEASDTSGQAIIELLTTAGHVVAGHRIVKDEPAEVKRVILDQLANEDVEVIITTGGTGITSRDSTFEAIDSVLELRMRNWEMQPRQRILNDEIVSGRDELGVLLMGHRKGAYWYGSQLTLAEARALAPHNSATTLQVAAGVLAGCVWAIRNPERDVVEPDQLPHDEILAIARPYLGEMLGAYTDWTPLADREWLFSESLDRDDPWQFVNFRVF